MFVECPICHDEINVTVTSLTQGSFYEPPDFDYDFEEEHPCQETWNEDTQRVFDDMVYQRAMEDRYSGNDYD